jgi:hypothetical protein
MGRRLLIAFYAENPTTCGGSFDFVAQLNRNADGVGGIFPAFGAEVWFATGMIRCWWRGMGGEIVGAGDHFLQPVVAAALFGSGQCIACSKPCKGIYPMGTCRLRTAAIRGNRV